MGLPVSQLMMALLSFLPAWLLTRLCGSQAGPRDCTKDRQLEARETGPPAIAVTCGTERAEVCPSGLKVNLN